MAEQTTDDYAEVRKRIEIAGDLELSQFLHAQGHGDHRWEKHKHVFADDMRKLGALFTHIAPAPMSLTVQKDSLEFSTTAHEVLFGATISSPLVPAGTRTGHLLQVEEGDIRMRGVLVLPEGKTASDIVTGTDATATHAMVIYGSTIAAMLDDYHGRFHQKGPGRIVYLTTEEKREKALKLHDAGALT